MSNILYNFKSGVHFCGIFFLREYIFAGTIFGRSCGKNVKIRTRKTLVLMSIRSFAFLISKFDRFYDPGFRYFLISGSVYTKSNYKILATGPLYCRPSYAQLY